jgi:hypothetical protein
VSEDRSTVEACASLAAEARSVSVARRLLAQLLDTLRRRERAETGCSSGGE